MRKNYILYMVMVAFATVSARAQEISIANTTARKVSDDKVEVSFRMDCSGLQLSTRRSLPSLRSSSTTRIPIPYPACPVHWHFRPSALRAKTATE